LDKSVEPNNNQDLMIDPINQDLNSIATPLNNES